MLEKCAIKGFIKNLSSQSKNILCTFCMKPYAGMELFSFTSDHAAWHETLLEPYCNQDDVAKQTLLQWTEVSTANATQFWQLTPASFGMFFDLASNGSSSQHPITETMEAMSIFLLNGTNICRTLIQ